MKNTPALLTTEWKVKCLLLLCSAGIYFLYFHHVLLHPNSVLAGITGDAFKNYYTFMFQSVHGSSALHFEGMNYPFGEHVIYTDCQPLLTFLFRPLKFLHPHLIGILHFLLFFSFIVTPVIIYTILRMFIPEKLPLIFFSLAITLLSPQFAKIGGGHHGLAYGALIPLALLLNLKMMRKRTSGITVYLSLFNFALFYVHPYVGFNTSLLTLFGGCICLITQQAVVRKKVLIQTLSSGFVPLALFQIFMWQTDHHQDRTTEPFGKNTLVENVQSLLVPDFGPFQMTAETILPGKTTHLETHSYLGAGTILVLLLSMVLLMLRARKIRIDRRIIPLLCAAILLLLFSFGLHNQLLEILGIKIASLNQFRALSRFAWNFYYVLPIFLVIFCYQNFFLLQKTWHFTAGGIIFLILNFSEAHHYLRFQSTNFWKERNLFCNSHISKAEQRVIGDILKKDVQAILSFPVFHVGSEMYGRIGADASMIPSFLYSYHTGKPIIGVFMSRTSITETENLLSILNSYKTHQPALDLMTDQEIFVVRTHETLWPDEDRLSGDIDLKPVHDYSVGFTSPIDLRRKKISKPILQFPFPSDSVLYINKKNIPPFIPLNMNSEVSIAKVGSDRLPPGDYLLSFHYYYQKKPYQPETLHLLILKQENGEEKWHQLQAVRVLSGFYNDFGVFEFPFTIDSAERYHIALKGMSDQEYHIRNFMIRPRNVTTIEVTEKDSLINNFPVRTF